MSPRERDWGSHPYWVATWKGGALPWELIVIPRGEARGGQAYEIARQKGPVADVRPVPEPFCYQPDDCAGLGVCTRAPRCNS